MKLLLRIGLTVVILILTLAGRAQEHWIRVEQVVWSQEPPASVTLPASFSAWKAAADSGAQFSAGYLDGLQQQLVSSLADSGYPFVTVRLEVLGWEDSLLSARLLVDPGIRVRIDSLVVATDPVIRGSVTERLTGIQVGEWYSHQQLDEANRRLDYYGLLNPDKPVQGGFFDSLAWVYLYPVKPRGSRFDGYVGFQPAPAGTVPALTGSVYLELNNLARGLETFRMRWKSAGDQTQSLELAGTMPYLLGSAFGLSAGLDLYRRDTSFLVLNTQAGVRWTFQPGSYMEGFYTYRQSREIARFGDSGRDFSLNQTGIRWFTDHTGGSQTRRQGWLWRQSVAAGRKLSSDAAGAEQGRVYVESSAFLTGFLPLGRSGQVAATLTGGYRSGDVEPGDRFRIGGANTMRGFQEEQFHTAAYGIVRFEMRLLIGGRSDLHTFLDGGWIGDTGWVYTPGVGLNLETRAGLLQLDFAWGQLAGNAFMFRNGVIHLGIESNF